MNDKLQRAGTRDFTLSSFLWRLVATFVLIVATYNPTALSYYGWLRSSIDGGTLGPAHFIVGVLLIIGWTILIVATRRSLSVIGFVLVAALVGGLVWFLTDREWLRVDSIAALTWVSLICLSIVLAIGLSWSHVWRRITGQYEVDDD